MNSYEKDLEKLKDKLKNAQDETTRGIYSARIRAIEPFCERTPGEILSMFDVGAFNDVLKAYCKVALKDSEVSRVDYECVMGQLEWLLDSVSAQSILKFAED